MAKPVANILASSSSRHVPKTGHVIGKRPVAGKSATHSPPSKVCFTFRFWRQIKFFGLSGKEASWFVALINKLQQFSDETIDAFTSDSRKHDVMRYHKVNWGQCNIPIQRSDLEWLPKNYLNNEEEFPIYQFSISQGQGRIAGFWDENKIFNIVLLDPYHNLQPVKKYDYKVTPTVEQLGEHELLVARLNLIKKSVPTCSGGQCSTQSAINLIDYHDQPFGILYLDAEYFHRANELIKSGRFKTTGELMELGIVAASS